MFVQKNDEMNQLDEGTSSDIVASYDVSKVCL